MSTVDYSVSSEAANRYASLLAKATGAEIIYLHSIATGLPYVGFCDLDVRDDKPDHCWRLTRDQTFALEARSVHKATSNRVSKTRRAALESW
jgi:hypothetical protein